MYFCLSSVNCPFVSRICRQTADTVCFSISLSCSRMKLPGPLLEGHHLWNNHKCDQSSHSNGAIASMTSTDFGFWSQIALVTDIALVGRQHPSLLTLPSATVETSSLKAELLLDEFANGFESIIIAQNVTICKQANLNYNVCLPNFISLCIS